MLILGTTADDKGAQLESLVYTILQREGYVRIVKNRVGAGGNELDVSGERESAVAGATQITPLLCEAKALASPVAMPAWQRFLGKLFIERTVNRNAVGMLVTLNGVNGNVDGSFQSLQANDSAIFIIGPANLIEIAEMSGEVCDLPELRNELLVIFQRPFARIELAYYNGGYYG